MAKIVTLKSPSDEDIYPVTDASGIRVTGNVTLQQALDGFVYADDPTAPANPNAWITPSEVDWSTMAPTTTTETTTGDFSMSWTKRVYPNGEIEWYGTGSFSSGSVSAHNAISKRSSLPVTFDASTMVFMANGSSNERMFSYDIYPSGSYLHTAVANGWTGAASNTVNVRVFIKQY